MYTCMIIVIIVRCFASRGISRPRRRRLTKYAYKQTDIIQTVHNVIIIVIIILVVRVFGRKFTVHRRHTAHATTSPRPSGYFRVSALCGCIIVVVCIGWGGARKQEIGFWTLDALHCTAILARKREKEILICFLFVFRRVIFTYQYYGIYSRNVSFNFVFRRLVDLAWSTINRSQLANSLVNFVQLGVYYMVLII